MITTSKPLPCPFCGGSAKIESRWNGMIQWRVKCRNRHNYCAVHPKTPYDYASKELAIQAWNRRAHEEVGNGLEAQV